MSMETGGDSIEADALLDCCLCPAAYEVRRMEMNPRSALDLVENDGLLDTGPELKLVQTQPGEVNVGGFRS